MNRAWKTLVGCVASLAAGSFAATPGASQTVDLQIVLPSAANMPRSFAAWEANPSVIQIVMQNRGQQDLSGLAFSFEVRGRQRGRVAGSTLGPAQPRVGLAPAERRSFLLDEVVNVNALDYASTLEAQIARDGIPEDAYQICAQIVDRGGVSVSGAERCFSFRVSEPDPPTLVFPVGSTLIEPQQLRFQWTPVSTPFASYRLVVKPLFAGQSPTDAMSANPVVLEEELNSPFYQYRPSDADFSLYGGTVGFVWQVQALSEGRPVGRNDGLSRVESFRAEAAVTEPEEPESPADPEPEKPRGPTNVDIPACGVEAAQLVVPADQEPGAFAAATLEGVTLRIGYFSMEVVKASGSPSALSGTGRISVPFLNRAVPVRFEGIKVNASMEVFDGTVVGTEEESASLDIDWMNATASLANISFTPTGATIDAALRYDLPTLNQVLGFAGRDMRITPNGVQSGSGRVGLSDDLSAPFGESLLRFKGSRSADDGTYIQWGCGGFERAQIVIEQEFPRSWLVPVTATGADQGGKVTVRYQTEINPQQTGLMPTGTLGRTMLAFAPGFIIEPTQLVLDLSSSANPTSLAFPARYQGSQSPSWMGAFVQSFTLSLPDAIRSFGRTTPVQISGRNIIIDRGGVSVSASVNNILTVQQGDLGGWGFSIDQFKLEVVNSSLLEGSLLGKVMVPISTTPMDYTATISVPEEGSKAATTAPPQGAAASSSRLANAAMAMGSDTTTGLKYSFNIKPAANIDATLWGSAKMSIASTSNISVSVQKVAGKTEFKPSAKLNGSLTVTQDVDLAGMRFQGFELLTSSPYVKVGTWSFASPQHFLALDDQAVGDATSGPSADGEAPDASAPAPAAAASKAAGLPITITKVEAIGRMEGSDIVAGLRFTANVNLPGAKSLFSASTTVQVLGKITQPRGAPMQARFHQIVLDQVCASGGVAGVMEIRRGSCLAHFRNDGTFGTGYSGQITATVMKNMTVNSTARFGAVRGIDYFYIDGGVTLSTGVAIPVINVVGFYGFNGGVFYHMTKQVSGRTSRYVPDARIALGLKAGVVLGTMPRPNALNGDLTLEAAFTTRGGVQYINLSGTGYMMAPITNRPNPAPVKASMNLTYNFPRNTLDGTFYLDINKSGVLRGGGQARLHASASKFLLHVGVGGSASRPQITNGSKFYVTLGNTLTGYAYLATGTAGTLPPFPSVPAGAPQPSSSARSTAVSRATGGGVMFGASVGLNFNIDGGVVGATVKGEAGFDVAMVDASAARCQGRPIGLDGWYGQGQMYGYITADGWVGMSESVTEWINDGFKWIEDVGCTISSWFGGCKKKKQAKYKAVVRVRPVRYSIAKVYAGATFQAGLPNPTWYAGTVELKYRVAGISNSTRQNFTQGTRCTP